MSAFNYPATAATATRLLEKFGAAATLRRVTGSAYDPATSTTVPTYASLATTAAVFAYDQKYIDGTLILQGDRWVLMLPSVEPKQGDEFVWGGKTLTVVSVTPTDPALVPVLYEAQIRG